MKPLMTPGFKLDEKKLALRETEIPLESADATKNRSCVMRWSYLSQDRADVGEPAKCLGRQIDGKADTQDASEISRKFARHLLGTKHMALHKQHFDPR